jgi:hypothetical protein
LGPGITDIVRFLFRKRKLVIPLFEGAGGGLYLKNASPFDSPSERGTILQD